jgi:ethanolamine transporter EutH
MNRKLVVGILVYLLVMISLCFIVAFHYQSIALDSISNVDYYLDVSDGLFKMGLLLAIVSLITGIIVSYPYKDTDVRISDEVKK